MIPEWQGASFLFADNFLGACVHVCVCVSRSACCNSKQGDCAKASVHIAGICHCKSARGNKKQRRLRIALGATRLVCTPQAFATARVQEETRNRDDCT
eukprot:1159738-Pelagomonas_calceolata.AAC.2